MMNTAYGKFRIIQDSRVAIRGDDMEYHDRVIGTAGTRVRDIVESAGFEISAFDPRGSRHAVHFTDRVLNDIGIRPLIYDDRWCKMWGVRVEFRACTGVPAREVRIDDDGNLDLDALRAAVAEVLELGGATMVRRTREHEARRQVQDEKFARDRRIRDLANQNGFAFAVNADELHEALCGRSTAWIQEDADGVGLALVNLTEEQAHQILKLHASFHPIPS